MIREIEIAVSEIADTIFSLTGAIPPKGGFGNEAHNRSRVPLSRPERLYVQRYDF